MEEGRMWQVGSLFLGIAFMVCAVPTFWWGLTMFLDAVVMQIAKR